MTGSWPRVQVLLPVAGWRLAIQAQPESRTLIEVTSARGSLVGLVLSSQQPMANSIDEAWHGHVCGAKGRRQWWALAIGHAPAGEGQLAVTFSRRRRGLSHCGTSLPLEVVDGLWLVHDGLWVAAAAGRYTHVRLVAQSATHVCRLRQVVDPS
jgi:hypothetical protein